MLNASFDHIEALIKCNANSLGEQTGSKHTNLRLLFQKKTMQLFLNVPPMYIACSIKSVLNLISELYEKSLVTADKC